MGYSLRSTLTPYMTDMKRFIGHIAAAAAFLSAFGFFQFAYPYHLMRREQLTLFLFDGSYISQTYRGNGFLGSFLGDFIDQFLGYPVLGPMIIALILTAIGFTAYKICRKFIGRWPSLAVAAVIFAWSFMRETGNMYITRYTIVVLGYLLLVLAALQFRKYWMKGLAAAFFLAFGVWSLGSPAREYYGDLWSTPNFDYDTLIGMDVYTAREDWDKVLKIGRKDPHFTEAAFCYNLAHAKKGDLAEELFNYTQNHANGLFLWVTEETSAFNNGMAGEVWYQIGDMTLAEQSAMVAMQASVKHTGTRFIKRLAEINLILGEDAAALKHLNMLSKTLRYRGWAKRFMVEKLDAEAQAWIDARHENIPTRDFVYASNDMRPVLLAVLEANPDNFLAREYLLAYDLLCFEVDTFMEDYSSYGLKGRLFEEGISTWLNMKNQYSEAAALSKGISQETVKRLGRFYNNPGLYKNTYWYYYMYK